MKLDKLFLNSQSRQEAQLAKIIFGPLDVTTFFSTGGLGEKFIIKGFVKGWEAPLDNEDEYEVGDAILNKMLKENKNPCPHIDTIWGKQNIKLPNGVTNLILSKEKEKNIIKAWDENKIGINIGGAGDKLSNSVVRNCLCAIIYSHVKVCKTKYKYFAAIYI